MAKTILSRKSIRSINRFARRRGAAMVEVALIMPFLLLLIFGIIDVGRILMLNQVTDTASREAVRRAIVPGMTQDEVLATANFYLDAAKVSQTGREILILDGAGNSTTLDQIDSNEYVSIQITVPYDRNTWGLSNIMGVRSLVRRSEDRLE